MSYLVFAFLCLAVTFVGAICGVGGGVILKPVLDLTSALSVAQISALCSVTVFAMTVSSLLSSREIRGSLKNRRSLLFAAGAVCGGLAGKALFNALVKGIGNQAATGMAQNALLFLLTLGTLWYEINRWKIRTHRMEKALPTLLVGLTLGMVSTFLGIGGGPFNLIVLIHCFSMSPKEAAAASLGIILFSQGVNLVELFALGGMPRLPGMALMTGALSGVAGGLIGRRAARAMDERQIDRLFLGLLAIILLICLGNIARYAGQLS